jgi:hypothetical protein
MRAVLYSSDVSELRTVALSSSSAERVAAVYWEIDVDCQNEGSPIGSSLVCCVCVLVCACARGSETVPTVEWGVGASP